MILHTRRNLFRTYEYTVVDTQSVPCFTFLFSLSRILETGIRGYDREGLQRTKDEKECETKNLCRGLGG